MNTDFSLLQTFMQGLAWIGIVINVAGLIICLRNMRLSDWMWLPALAFFGFALSGASAQIAYLVMQNSFAGVDPVSFYMMAAAASSVVAIASVLMLVVGIGLVFRDVRRRIDDMHRFG